MANGEGKLPEGWRWVKLGTVCRIVGGGTPSKDRPDFYTGNIPWATVRDMNGDAIVETEYRITQEAVRCSATNIIPAGNVVLATRVGLGKVCLVNEDTAINQDLKGIIPNDPEELTTSFLFFWFRNISRAIEKEGVGATVKGVKLPYRKSLLLPLPPLPEQRRIAAILNASMAEVEKARAAAQGQLDEINALPASLLHQAFNGEL